jgi:hypothetical protein
MQDAEFQKNKERLKVMLRQIPKECDPVKLVELKKEFKNLLSQVSPLMISIAESELVNEGYSQDELMSVCDIHLEFFRENIQNPDLDVPEDHPIATFNKEHTAIMSYFEKLRGSIKALKAKGSFDNASDELNKIEKIFDKLKEAESHNVRQENTLFPALEKQGIERPPAIMWQEHNDMKDDKKKIHNLLNERDNKDFDDLIGALEAMATLLAEKFANHTQKEQNILYVTALKVLSDNDWNEIKEECDELGYFDLNLSL